jgi:ParB-like nuclease domain
LKASIRRFGFRQPILARKDGQIVAGHERVEASKELGLKEIPVIWIENLSEAEIRAYVIADNKIALLAGWDKEKLVNELQFLVELGFELEPIGFDAPEVDLLLESVGESQHDSSRGCGPAADPRPSGDHTTRRYLASRYQRPPSPPAIMRRRAR